LSPNKLLNKDIGERSSTSPRRQTNRLLET